ncbi:hypothetical protein BD770DRAFT_441528 [Pilaira anomala]|nr:hypothetical protein BD770DRAFT_441528 [Pilaira anomala]
MSKLSSAEIRCEPCYRDYKSKSVHKESHMTLLFQVVNAFKGNKKAVCAAELSDFRSNDKTMNYSNGVLINVIYGLTHQEIYGHNQNKARFDFELVCCTANDQLTAYKILKYTLTSCHYLQYVGFVAINDHCLESNLSNHISRLSYYSCKRLEPSTKTEDNLKVIKFVNFIPSGNFINVLATYLPNMLTISAGTINLDMEFYLTKFNESFKLKLIIYVNGQELIEFKKAEFTSSDTSQELSSVPTLTINCKRVMELIEFKIPEGKLIEIKDGVLQEARFPNFNDKSAYND